jgi:uncharacterized protein
VVDYLIIARSGRALAASAKRAGYKVSVADYFADEDTRSFSESVCRLQYHCDGFVAEELLIHIQDVITSNPKLKLVIGSGFESTPELLDSLAELAPVFANSRESIIALKEPVSFFEMLDRNSIQHPDVLFSKPIDSKDYLIKRIAGIGGGHVNWCDQVDSEQGSTCYFQKFIHGIASSVVFLANGLQTSIVGFNQQLQSSEFADMPFLYQGAVTTDNEAFENRDVIERIINKITEETGLKGLCGLDYIIDECGQIIVLEVNPRPPATFELHEVEHSLFDAHLACFDGLLINDERKDDNAKKIRSYAIFYAKNELRINDKINWPLWVKDRPSFGTKIPLKFPVCTVHAQENSIDKVKSLLFNRLKKIESIFAAMQNAA